MTQAQIPSSKPKIVKFRESTVLGTVTDVEKLDVAINSSVDVLKENIVVNDGRRTAFEYWLDTDVLISLGYSDDGKTLYALVVTADKTLMLLVFDIIQ